jgi:transposase-like protein
MGAKKKRRTFTAEFKAEVVEQVRTSGKKSAEIARELGLSESSVRAWMRQADVEGVRAARAEVAATRTPARAMEASPIAPPDESEGYLPPRPALVEPAPALSAFRMIEARASLPRVSGPRPPRLVSASSPAPTPPPAPRCFALLVGAAAPLLVVGALFLARPAEGGAQASPTETRPVASAVSPAPAASHYVARLPAAPPEPSPAAPPLAPAPASSLTPAMPPPASSAPPASLGTIVTTTTSHEHRIFVDGRTVGETGSAIAVRCGHHQARYGSHGRWQTIDVPCGGQYTLQPSW